ncbi:MAG: pilus assembly protein PilP [Myxococcales bacterium]|nr:pilus assembly protein PilP [Myxococcales bacterium]
MNPALMDGLRRRYVVVLAGALIAPLVACGDDGDGDEMQLPPPRPAEQVAAAEAAAPAAAAATSLITEIDRREFSSGARDPFTPPELQVAEATNETIIRPECNVEVEPLGALELTSVKLIGLLTGTPVPRAIFSIPGQNEAVFVSEGAKLGPDCSFQIVEIRENAVVLEQLTDVEEQRTQTTIPLNPEGIEATVVTNR